MKSEALVYEAVIPVIPVTTRNTQCRRLRLDGLDITHARYATCSTPKHCHEKTICTMTLVGAWQESVRGQVYRCQPGSILLKPGGEPHCDQLQAPGIEVLMIEVDPHPSWPLDDSLAPLWPLVNVFDQTATVLGWRVVRELNQADSFTPLVVEGLVFELLGTVARQVTTLPRERPPVWLEQVREMIHAEFGSTLRVTDLARAARVNPIRLTRAFRRHFRTSPGEYLRRTRLGWATVELVTTERPLTHIALEAGFSDQSHFTRSFKRHTGVTPLQYRKTARR